MILAALVPALPFFLFAALARPRCPDWRTALLVAAVLWGIAVVAVTEALSPVQAVRPGPLLGAWLALTAILAWRVWRGGRARIALGRPEIRLGGAEAAMLLAVAAIAGAIGAVALAAPPNTYDSMTYHMSRVAHWAQNGNVGHYPTTIARQLHQPPWAEFAILQSYVLSGGDRLANLVQWFSMLGVLAGVSLVTGQLGGDRRTQILAAAVAATLPIGVVQASGTKNDYVAALWLTCLAVFTLVLNRQGDGGVAAWTALTGGALGLALLTKATCYLFGLPFVAWIWLARVRREGGKAWRVVAGIAIVAAAINTGHLLRNHAHFGTPIGPGHEGPFAYANGSLGVAATVSVAIRNAGLHLGTPWPSLNAWTDAAIGAAHRILGRDVNEPSTTWPGTRFAVSAPARHEDAVSNGLHLALIAVALAALALSREVRTGDRLAYAAVLVMAFVLFCAVLRWQPWHSRLQLPLFALWAPLIAIALARRPWAAAPVVAALVAVAMVMVLANEPRPLAGRRNALRQPRQAQYFRARPALRGPYTDAVRLLADRGCSHVGLSLGGDDWEYPLWVLARTALPGARLEHVEIPLDLDRPGRWPNASSSVPCGIVATRLLDGAEMALAERGYRRALSTPEVALFAREGARAPR
jgi:hypothetical protein